MSNGILQFPTQAWEALAEIAKAHAVKVDKSETFDKNNTEELEKELIFGPTISSEDCLKNPVLMEIFKVIKRLRSSEDRSKTIQVMTGRNEYVFLKISGPYEVRKIGPTFVEVISK